MKFKASYALYDFCERTKKSILVRTNPLPKSFLYMRRDRIDSRFGCKRGFSLFVFAIIWIGGLARRAHAEKNDLHSFDLHSLLDGIFGVQSKRIRAKLQN